MDERIQMDLWHSYGIPCHTPLPVPGGWLNKKWRVTSDGGDYLVKQFSYARYNGRQLGLIEAALQRQLLLYRDDVPCPGIVPYKGAVIRLLGENIAYMVMSFHPGSSPGPGSVTLGQMYSLGSACGRMHLAFSRLPLFSADGRPVAGYPADPVLILRAFSDNIRACRQAGDIPAPFYQTLSAQQAILDALSPAFFARFTPGLAHEDFSCDNLLFDGENCTILDFDRNCFSYPLHDIGRALLSLALTPDGLDAERVRSFVEGYKKARPLSLSDVPDALRLTLCIEAPWWLNPAYLGEQKEKIVRFKDEMLWLIAHWDDLDSLIL